MKSKGFGKNRTILADVADRLPLGELWLARYLIDGGMWSTFMPGTLSFRLTGEDRAFMSQAFFTWVRGLARRWTEAHPDDDSVDSLTCAKLVADLTDPDAEVAVPDELASVYASLVDIVGDRAYESPTAEANFTMLRDLFSLSDCEARVLYWIVWFSRDSSVRTLFNDLGYANGGVGLYAEVLSCATGMDRDEVRQALSGEGRLFRTGLIGFGCRDLKNDIEDWFEFFDEELGGRLLVQKMSSEEMIKTHLKPAPAATLELADFQRLPEVTTLLIPYLSKALATGRKGVNILLYGPPGTGKTELTRTVNAALEATAWEVVTNRPESKNQDRLRHWQVADRLLGADGRCCLVLDEAEDVFHNLVMLGGGDYLRTNKGEVNELLESNVHPTFWVLNSIRMIDPAMMRRFDLVLEVPMPSVKERRRMVAKIADTRLSAGFCERLARTEALSPGVMTRAIAVASELETTSSEDLEHRVEEIVNAQLAAVNAGSVKGVRGSCDVYSIDLLQVSADLRSLAEGIARTGSARLCLYGPPGTGKTAWARHLAETLDRPILVKKASDLLSCWVGGTEANLAAAFREAKREEAVLLIDEADSFLQDRTKSVRSWETTQVNEMLTQIETFDGIFVATTNLIETLDAASLRRFDLKIRFDAMTAPNARRLLAAHLTALGLPAAEEETLCALDAVPSLTPGDFAAVVRRSRLLPLTDAEDFVRRLAEETALKTDVRHRRRPIGF